MGLKSKRSRHKEHERYEPQHADGAWKDVAVGFSMDGVENDNDCTGNHYDDPELSRKATSDLPAQPGEDVAMFYGLQVLDGSQYQVVGTGTSKRLKILSSPKGTSTGPSSEPDTATNATDVTTTQSDRKKEKQRKKTKGTSSVTATASETTPSPEDTETPTVTSSSWKEVQRNWTLASGGAVLDQRLCESLDNLGFLYPTPIQAATLSATILGRRNLVGAAPTGSGKTLAFLLPIFQSLLEESYSVKKLRALIIAPTRELATQIHAECEKLSPNQCVALVGGVAQVKQQRLLETRHPPIIVGTPGRLWAMISSREYQHLKDLSQIKFLVMDEADRLTQDHSFPQLVKILERIHEENPGLQDQETTDELLADSEEEDRLLALPGIQGEAPLEMLTPEILQQIEQQRQSTIPQPQGSDDSSEGSVTNEDDMAEPENDEKSSTATDKLQSQAPVHRQTLIYSATLTLPFTSTKASSHKSKRNLPLHGGLADILEKAHAMGETKVVDLTSESTANTTTATASSPNGVKLPPGLHLEQIKCTQRHKDSHLYAYLMTTKQGSSGPSLIFCNSIAAVRRVGATLQTLGLSVRILHAHMEQRARFKAVESLSKESNSRSVVVCTDVAARGLDIPSVATVIHYDVARAVDTFVHRAGRTARGMGEKAVGSSLSLVAPAEDKSHTKITQSLQASFSKVLLDGRLLAGAQERVNLATKVVVAAEKLKTMQSRNQWFLEKAKEADLELDDDLLEDDDNMAERERNELREAKEARLRLTKLLQEPLKTQKFGKFLSTNSAAMQDEIKPLSSVVSSTSMDQLRPKKKRKITKNAA